MLIIKETCHKMDLIQSEKKKKSLKYSNKKYKIKEFNFN